MDDPVQNADLLRRTANLVRLGTVAEVDLAAARVRVASGDLVTAWLPWLVWRAGDARTWWAPSVGEQVSLLCPSGDPAQGLVLGAVYSSTAPAPSDSADIVTLVCKDGAEIRYDAEHHQLSAVLPAGGKVIVAGDVDIDGDVAVTGDVVAGSVSLRSHAHTNVDPGLGTSGPPVGGGA